MPELTQHRSKAGQSGPPRVYRARPLFPRDRWRCGHCGRHLALIDGPVFLAPRGVRGHLPASIRCPSCKARNVYGGGQEGAA